MTASTEAPPPRVWDLSCPDWEQRIRTGRAPIPELPLNRQEADLGLAMFDKLRLPDVPGKPALGDAAGEWFRQIVRASFGSWDPVERLRYIRDILVLAPKGSSKTSYGAGWMITGMLMNRRPRAEALFVGPTQAISDRAYEQAVGMIDEDPDLKRRFRPRDHVKTIEDLLNGSEMRVKTFGLDILTGSILIMALLDEIHLLGRNVHTTRVLRQLRGGLSKTPEGVLMITTTQSDDVPAGAFKAELHMARSIRDGQHRGKDMRPMLPVLYEFPAAIAKDPAAWQDAGNWPLVMPNLGRSVHMRDVQQDWETERTKGDYERRVWASQYLNIEIGIGMKTDAWPGAEHWADATDDAITIESILARCEAVVIGFDGGGLDDLSGLAIVGREPAEIEVPVTVDGREVVIRMKRWVSLCRAWCHRGVLERRKSIAAQLLDFEEAGDLRIVDDVLVAVAEAVAMIQRVDDAGLLACVAIDSEGPYGVLVDALAAIGITQDGGQVEGVGQGYKLMNAIKTSEVRLSNGMLVHAPSPLMDWCVGNLKIEPTATAIRATKQNAGDAKIDPVMALFDAATVMTTNPEAGGVSVFDQMAARDGEAPGQADDPADTGIDMAILGDPAHPRWQEMRERYERRLSVGDEEYF